jgi:hypothetical protein
MQNELYAAWRQRMWRRLFMLRLTKASAVGCLDGCKFRKLASRGTLVKTLDYKRDNMT